MGGANKLDLNQAKQQQLQEFQKIQNELKSKTQGKAACEGDNDEDYEDELQDQMAESLF